MKKSERLALIRQIVLEHTIETQNDLVALLRKEGLNATQATISRDINEIGIVKIPAANNRYVYGLSKETIKKPTIQQARNVLYSSIKGVSEETVGLAQYLHLDLVPGNTRLVKRKLVEQFRDLMFSCLADDDSILIIAKDETGAKQIRKQVIQWMKKG